MSRPDPYVPAEPAPAGNRDTAWSCVVDDTRRIWASIIPWLATATGPGVIDRSRIYVHHVCALRPEIERVCRELGVNTHRIERFDPDYPHTNKIQQCFTDYGDAGRVVLTDVDVVFARPPPLHEVVSRVAGKTVDAPNPPVEILCRLFAAAGVPRPPTVMNAYLDSRDERVDFETYAGNFNGGLYVLERGILGHIARRWARWARWLIANIHLIDRWHMHVDQVAFCLAAAEMGEPVVLLEDAWNFPLQFNVIHDGKEPIVLHHHGLQEKNLLLKKESAPVVAWPAIDHVNDAIVRFQNRYSTT